MIRIHCIYLKILFKENNVKKHRKPKRQSWNILFCIGLHKKTGFIDLRLLVFGTIKKWMLILKAIQLVVFCYGRLRKIIFSFLSLIQWDCVCMKMSMYVCMSVYICLLMNMSVWWRVFNIIRNMLWIQKAKI